MTDAIGNKEVPIPTREEVVAHLLNYGCHEPSCAAHLFIPRACNCGWSELRKRLQQEKKP